MQRALGVVLVSLSATLAVHEASHVEAKQDGPVPGLSLIETPEVLDRVRKLIADNVEPTLRYWRGVIQQRDGRKLTMQNFFQTARALMIRKRE